MTKSEFFYYLGQSVKYAPEITVAENKVVRLSTFATAREPADLNTENLQKTVFDRSGRYFYSRLWEAARKPANRVVFEYPLLVCYDIRPALKGQFGSTNAMQCSTLQLSCLYPNVEKQAQDIKVAAKALLLDEIYRATLQMMQDVATWIKGAVYANADGVITWYNYEWLQQEVTDGRIISVIPYDNITNAFKLRNRNMNSNMAGSWVDDLGKDALCGLTLPFEFCEPNCMGSVTIPGGFNIVGGYYDSDEMAAADGVKLHEIYYLSLANVYGTAEGVLKQRIA